MDPHAMNSMWVWYLGDPRTPRLVGEVSLTPRKTSCSFEYAQAWISDGFSLSPDMPFPTRGKNKTIIPGHGRELPGALADAMPDRWGRSTILAIDRPPRKTPLDFLYLAGDRRFGALGISTSPDKYEPSPRCPAVAMASLEEASKVIRGMIDKRTLDERERLLLGTGRSMGGAQPKMLVDHDGGEWICKFPKGDPVDYPLIEHATMRLAALCGICAASSQAIDIADGHVVMIRRFDRIGSLRRHAISADTAMIDSGDESYGGMAEVIRKRATMENIKTMRSEIHRRMIFNFYMDNTDDHSKNHSFILCPNGTLILSPAYDMPPQMNGTGAQALSIAHGVNDYTVASMIAAAPRFGLSTDEAVDNWRRVTTVVSKWKDFFAGQGVLGMDIDYLSDTIDNDFKLSMRAETALDDAMPKARASERQK